MFKLFYSFFVFISAYVLISGDIIEEIPSLPFCQAKNGSGLVIVSTLDGKLSALNSTGSLIWQINTGPGPLLTSNIHKLELTNNGEWIRIIPSLTGTLYKFDGSTIDPIPITAESLLKSSFRYSDDLVIAGGIEVRTYGVGFRSGKVFYECTPLRCENSDNQDVDDVLLIERSTHTIRAVEPRTGTERWNFSVGLHNIKLPRVSCIDVHSKLFDWNLTAILPEGKLRASTVQNNVENSWQYTFTAPIVRVWRWSGKNLTELNLFAPRNIPSVITTAPYLPSIYIGMHNKQLYIHESVTMQNTLNQLSNTNLVVADSTSLAKIPWKPIPASTETTEDDSTALSVLNGSEYVNGNGYYLYSETDIKKKDSLLCEKNHTFIPAPDKEVMENIEGIYSWYLLLWWKEGLLMLITFLICNFLFRFWSHHQKQHEIVIIEKPVEAQITTERTLSERENEAFTSRYVNDFDTLRCLGKGGFGVVFEVKQKIDECSYAIKRITLPNEQGSRDRVMREVRALAKLEHQNIVRYFCSWVEHPPIGWQQEYDQKWIGDKPFGLDGTTTTATSSYISQKTRRSKSVSISIEIPMQKCDQVSFNFDDDTNKEDDDDSFIVFEHADSTEISNCTLSSAIRDDTTKTMESQSSSSSETTSQRSSPMTDHLRKKIDWRRPGRRHHSWDLSSQANQTHVKPQEPPVFLYIQMQLCQKESLKEWLNTNSYRDYKLVLDIFLQILEAVEYVHLRGLIHRDLKPSNIFFSLNGQIKVGDFGLVKDMEDAFDLELIKKGSSPSYRGHTVEVGTQLYMSPEQFQSRIYDYKVDIYSLGLIFFELLVPFSTDMERIKTLTDVKKAKYPKNFQEKFPNEYSLLQNMLCQNPNKRLTTIGIKARPPFNKDDPHYCEDWHFRLNNFNKN